MASSTITQNGRIININTDYNKLIETDFSKKTERESITKSALKKCIEELTKLQGKSGLSLKKMQAIEEVYHGHLYLEFLYERKIQDYREFLNDRRAQQDEDYRQRQVERDLEAKLELARSERMIATLNTRRGRLAQRLSERARRAPNARDVSPTRSSAPAPARERESGSIVMDVDVTNEAKRDLAPVALPGVPMENPVRSTPAQPDSPSANEISGMMNSINIETKEEEPGTLEPDPEPDAFEDTEMEVEELKVYLDKKTLCAICPKKLDRNDISALDCGHCFHFMCAIKSYANDVKHRCPVCRIPMETVPRSTQESLAVIGEETLTRAFGPVRPVQLSSRAAPFHPSSARAS